MSAVDFSKIHKNTFILSISGRNYFQILNAVVRSVLKKQVFKFWPWRLCLRAILFQEKGTSFRSMSTRGKRSCLVVLKYYKKSLEKFALVREKFPNFCDKTRDGKISLRSSLARGPLTQTVKRLKPTHLIR